MTLLAGLLLLLSHETTAASSCVDWKTVIGKQRLQELPEGKTLLLESLANQTGHKEDEWLNDGIRDFLSDLLTSSRSLRVLSGLTADAHGRSSVDYQLKGQFQRGDNKLRVFLALYSGGGALQQQFAIAIPYPAHRDFFTALATTAAELLTHLQYTYDTSLFEATRDATSSVAALEAYARGRQLFETYDLAHMDEALAFFHKAKAIDFRSPLGYQGTVDLLTFLGLAKKQEQKAFASFFQRAEEELLTMQKLVKPELMVPALKRQKKPTKKEIPSFKLENRFLLGHASFVRGLHELSQQNTGSALQAFEQAVQHVPEDAIAWLQLAQLSEKRGKSAKAKEAKQRVRNIAPCLIEE